MVVPVFQGYLTSNRTIPINIHPLLRHAQTVNLGNLPCGDLEWLRRSQARTRVDQTGTVAYGESVATHTTRRFPKSAAGQSNGSGDHGRAYA